MEHSNEQNAPIGYDFNNNLPIQDTHNMELDATMDPSVLGNPGGDWIQEPQPPVIYQPLIQDQDVASFNSSTNEQQHLSTTDAFDWQPGQHYGQQQHNFAPSNANTFDGGMDPFNDDFAAQQQSAAFPPQHAEQFNAFGVPDQRYTAGYAPTSHPIQIPQVPDHTIMTGNNGSGESSAGSFHTAPVGHSFEYQLSAGHATRPVNEQEALWEFYSNDQITSHDNGVVRPPLDDGNSLMNRQIEQFEGFQGGESGWSAGAGTATMIAPLPDVSMAAPLYSRYEQNAALQGVAPMPQMISHHARQQHGMQGPASGSSIFRPLKDDVGQARVEHRGQEFGTGGVIPASPYMYNTEGSYPLRPSPYSTNINGGMERPLLPSNDRGVYRPGMPPFALGRLQPNRGNAAQQGPLRQQAPLRTNTAPAGKKRKAAQPKTSRKRARVAAKKGGEGKPARGEEHWCIDCDEKPVTPPEVRCKRCKRSWERVTATTPVLPYIEHTWAHTLATMYPEFPGNDRKMLQENPGLEEYRESLQEEWVRRYLRCAEKPFDRYDPICPVRDRPEKDLRYFKKQQETLNGNCRMEAFPRVVDGKDRYELDTISMRMRMLFRCVLHFHNGGHCVYTPDGDNRGYGPPEKFTFEDRLEHLAGVMEWDKRIVIDVIEGRGVRAFALTPTRYCQRKRANASSNAKKKGRQGVLDDDDPPIQDAVEEDAGEEDADDRSNAGGEEEEGEEQDGRAPEDDPPPAQTTGLALPPCGQKRRQVTETIVPPARKRRK